MPKTTKVTNHKHLITFNANRQIKMSEFEIESNILKAFPEMPEDIYIETVGINIGFLMADDDHPIFKLMAINPKDYQHYNTDSKVGKSKVDNMIAQSNQMTDIPDIDNADELKRIINAFAKLNPKWEITFNVA